MISHQNGIFLNTWLRAIKQRWRKKIPKRKHFTLKMSILKNTISVLRLRQQISHSKTFICGFFIWQSKQTLHLFLVLLIRDLIVIWQNKSRISNSLIFNKCTLEWNFYCIKFISFFFPVREKQILWNEKFFTVSLDNKILVLNKVIIENH